MTTKKQHSFLARETVARNLREAEKWLFVFADEPKLREAFERKIAEYKNELSEMSQ